MKGKFAYGKARVHESSYNYCWSSYIYVLEFSENPFTGGMKRFATRSAQLQNAKRKNGQKVEIEDNDVFRFRATWVMHTYLGNTKGFEFSSAPEQELSPQKFKIFARLDQLAIVGGDNAVKVPSSDLSGMSMNLMAHSGPETKCDVITDEGGPFGLRDVSAWHASSDVLFVYGWPDNITSGIVECETPLAVYIPGADGTGVVVPLWSRATVDGRNYPEDNLVLRHGTGIPISPWDGKALKELVPKVQCDWEKAGFGKRQRKGGCINLGVSRVFVMSKSKNDNFLEVINHIEKALNPSVNAGTAPPKRPGHNWANQMRPPAKTSTVSPVSKVIPGNWAAGGAALTKVNGDGGKLNRSFFQNIYFITTDPDTGEEKHWPDVPLDADGNRPTPTERQVQGSNYCKYYFSDKYNSEAKKWLYGLPLAPWIHCDEYPFASTLEGAGKKDGNYSLQAVKSQHNLDHGEALDSFYADYRVVPTNQFWVKIVS